MPTIILNLPEGTPLPTPQQKERLEQLIPFLLDLQQRSLAEVFADSAREAEANGNDR